VKIVAASRDERHSRRYCRCGNLSDSGETRREQRPVSGYELGRWVPSFVMISWAALERDDPRAAERHQREAEGQAGAASATVWLIESDWVKHGGQPPVDSFRDRVIPLGEAGAIFLG
jgi:hypothetical protein